MTAAELTDVVLLRPGTVEDHGRVFSDWLHSFWDTAKGRMPKTVFMGGQHRVVEQLLNRARIVVLSPTDAPNHIIGWAVGEHLGGVCVLHYAYVKKEYRHLGFAQRLVAELKTGCDSIQHTHETKAAEGLLTRLGSTFNPFITGVAW
jgi:ribosomal protein S18 acetylase RimI-like enzyme